MTQQCQQMIFWGKKWLKFARFQKTFKTIKFRFMHNIKEFSKTSSMKFILKCGEILLLMTIPLATLKNYKKTTMLMLGGHILLWI